MAKYRAHPIEVEAVQWDGTPEMADQLVSQHGYILSHDYTSSDRHLRIAVESVGASGVVYLYLEPLDWLVKWTGMNPTVFTHDVFASLFGPA